MDLKMKSSNDPRLRYLLSVLMGVHVCIYIRTYVSVHIWDSMFWTCFYKLLSLWESDGAFSAALFQEDSLWARGLPAGCIHSAELWSFVGHSSNPTNSTPVNQVSYHSLRGCYPLGWLQAYIFLNATDKTKRKECEKLQAALLCIAHMKAIHVRSLPQAVRMCSNANAKLRSSLSTTWSPSSCWSWQQVGAASRKQLRKQRSPVCPCSPWMSHSLHGTCAQCR